MCDNNQDQRGEELTVAVTEPITTIDERFSAENATASTWAEAERLLETAEVYWVTTVRADGRPHVTPLIAVWQHALYFCTGPGEQKAKNVTHNPHVVITTGTNVLGEGTDVVVEGDAALVEDDDRLRQLAAAWEAKYGADWHFDVRDGRFRHDAGDALVFEVAPVTVFGFRKGDYSQTRWAFGGRSHA
jgi:general stress protein 26